MVIIMTLRVNLDEKLEIEFRKKAMKRFGYKKGSINKALTEAIKEWISQQSNAVPLIDQPTESLKNMLAELKETSLELQHSAKDLFIKEE